MLRKKNIAKYEKNEDKTKIFKIVQSNNKIIFKDITKLCETEEKEKELVKKIKISLKKDEDENEKIIYEVSNKEEKWEFKRHIKNIINRINRGRITYRVNFNKLKYIYIMKFNDDQIQFIKTNAISNYVYNYNYYVKIRNGFVFVNNKRRKFYNRKNKFNAKKFNNNRNFKRNNTNISFGNNNNRSNKNKQIGNRFNRKNNNRKYNNGRRYNNNNRFKNRYNRRFFKNKRRYNNNRRNFKNQNF